MKKVIIVTLIIVFIILSVWLWKESIFRNNAKYSSLIAEQCDSVYSSTYPYKKSEDNAFKVNINIDRPITLMYWKQDFWGDVAINIEAEKDGSVIKTLKTKHGYFNEKISLQSGNYLIKVKFDSMMGGMVIGYTNLPDNIRPLKDTDSDGLPDEAENKYGTAKNNQDTDGDGLSDYQEVVKYRTNPLKRDSDHDGKIDGDWDERREYAYTIQAIVDLRVPHNLNDMNDLFQDTRILKEIGNNAARVEVILYPETNLIVNPAKFRVVNNEYTAPTFTKNYSAEMKQVVKKKIANRNTDLQVIRTLISELSKAHSVDIVKDLAMDSDMPLDFALIKSQNHIKLTPERKSAKYPLAEVQKKVLFADSMYQNMTRAACGSTAILRGGLLRAAGIQERSVFTIPLFYSLKSDRTVIKVKEKYINQEFLNLPSEGESYWVDHVLNEALIGNQWVQVDFGVRDSFDSLNNSWNIKTINFNDPSEVDFYHEYSKLDFFKERPYQYISIIEQAKKY